MADSSASSTQEGPTHGLATLFSLSQDSQNLGCSLRCLHRRWRLGTLLWFGRSELPSALRGLQMQSCHTTLGRLHASRHSLPLMSDATEQVRYGLEVPESGTYQRRVGHMRLLGEMYNFRLVDSK